MKSPTADLTQEQQAAYDVARFRWRADLLEMGAAQLDTIGHADDADAKRETAKAMCEMADAIEAFEAVVAEHGGMSDEGQRASARLRSKRRELREAGRRVVESLDNFTEPTPTELGVI